MKILETALAKLIAVEWRLAKYAMKSCEYSFSQDYVSHRSPLWTQHLSELRGQENVRMLESQIFGDVAQLDKLFKLLLHALLLLVFLSVL